MAAATTELDALEVALDGDMKRVGEYRALIDSAEQTLAPSMDSFRQRRAAMQSAWKRLKTAEAAAGSTPSPAAQQELEALRTRLQAAQTKMDSVASARPSTGSMFIRLFLGRVNVKAALKKDKLKLRDEYNKFKYRANTVFFLLPCICFGIKYGLAHTPYAFKYSEWISVLSHIWLLYYYVSLALRENILKVNGSNIREWWIYHHYISATMSIVMLTWPPTPTHNSFMNMFQTYFLFQGFVQLLQARYQSRRHYTLVSLGHVSSMDVSSTETLTEMHSGLYLVLLFVGLAQLFQLYCGYVLLEAFRTMDKSSAWWEFREEVQVFFLGVAFVLLAVCNFTTTLRTVKEKRARMQRANNPAWSAPGGKKTQ